MLQDPVMRPRLVEAMFDAQSGRAAAALLTLEGLVAEMGTAPSYTRAVVEYIRAIAAFELGEYEIGLTAVDVCIDVAHAIDEPGWESVACSLRVGIQARMAAGGGDSIDDLVRAEATLAASTDRELVAWAHVGLGGAYQVLRLYELALPHRKFSIGSPLDVLGLPESEVIDWLNLADCNLRLVQELEQLGDPAMSPRSTLRGRRPPTPPAPRLRCRSATVWTTVGRVPRDSNSRSLRGPRNPPVPPLSSSASPRTRRRRVSARKR